MGRSSCPRTPARLEALLAALLIAALAAHAAWAEEAPGRRVVLPVSVNGLPRGEWTVLLRDADVLVRTRDLEGVGLRVLAGTRAGLGGEEFVSLASLGEDVPFALDPAALTLEIRIAPERMGRNVVEVGAGRPENLVQAEDTSAFLNYAFNWRDDLGLETFAEAGLSVRGNLLLGSVTRRADGGLARGMTSFTIDRPERMQRWVVGDAYATAGGLGGSLFLGGVGFVREFGLDPYFVRFPTLSLSGAVSTPSTADVYVNGALVRRQALPPGEFDLTDVVVPAGAGTAEVVIRDAFGQQQALTAPFYSTNVLLKRGLQDWGYHLGLRREDPSGASPGYDAPTLVGRHRAGLTEHLTLGGHVEADPDLLAAGATLGARLPFGELEGALAASAGNGASGTAAGLFWRWIGRRASLGTLARAQSERYANLALPPEQDRTLLELSAFAGAQVGSRASLNVQLQSLDARDGADRRRLSLGGAVRLAQAVNLVASAHAQSTGRETVLGGSVSLAWFLGRNTSVSAASELQDGETRFNAEVQRPLPFGTGPGYRVNLAAERGEVAGGALVQYQGDAGRYEASLDRVAGRDFLAASASGGIVAIGGTIAATRAVRDGFALVRVPGAGGVRGYWSNQVVGRTNRRGDLLVANLLSYQGNRLGIEDRDLPFDYRIGAREITVATPWRGGALVTFPAQRIRTVRGALVVLWQDTEIVPAYGTLSVAGPGGPVVSPIGAGGEFELSDLPAGRHAATIEFERGTCGLELEVPASLDAVIALGTLRCTVEVAP